MLVEERGEEGREESCATRDYFAQRTRSPPMALRRFYSKHCDSGTRTTSRNLLKLRLVSGGVWASMSGLSVAAQCSRASSHPEHDTHPPDSSHACTAFHTIALWYSSQKVCRLLLLFELVPAMFHLPHHVPRSRCRDQQD